MPTSCCISPHNFLPPAYAASSPRRRGCAANRPTARQSQPCHVYLRLYLSTHEDGAMMRDFATRQEGVEDARRVEAADAMMRELSS